MTIPTVTFATSCWERDWRLILLDPNYLKIRQIENQCHSFAERLLVINNVVDKDAVERAAQVKVDEGVLTRYVFAKDILEFFGLKRSDFDDRQYYNALGPLTSIYHCRSEYLLFLMGDVFLKKPVHWIDKALRCMEKNGYKVANLTWNDSYRCAKKESYRTTWNFYIAKQGFSDQMFLVRRADFIQPIYNEIRSDASHFPWGDIFEKRVFSAMKNRDWKRIIYRHGSYTHENVVYP